MSQVCDDIKKLHKSLIPLCEEFLTICKERNLNVKLYETLRTDERQQELFKKGVTKIKTRGMHGYGLAFDVVFDDKSPWGEHHSWSSLGQVGKDLGLIWGGDWKNFNDRPHFQIVTLAEQKQVHKGWAPDIFTYPTLKLKDNSAFVRTLQVKLNDYVEPDLVTDGIFGGKTLETVKKVQKQYGLTPDGIVRRGTWLALGV